MKIVMDIPDEIYKMSDYCNILESCTYQLARCVKKWQAR